MKEGREGEEVEVEKRERRERENGKIRDVFYPCADDYHCCYFCELFIACFSLRVVLFCGASC